MITIAVLMMLSGLLASASLGACMIRRMVGWPLPGPTWPLWLAAIGCPICAIWAAHQ